MLRTSEQVGPICEKPGDNRKSKNKAGKMNNTKCV